MYPLNVAKPGAVLGLVWGASTSIPGTYRKVLAITFIFLNKNSSFYFFYAGKRTVIVTRTTYKQKSKYLQPWSPVAVLIITTIAAMNVTILYG